ncbi:MAG: isoaspartyl peptidase/L-asparaginase [Myxococcota bacterium]|nr:isoaspartyl peptidase/L-asparaginase [Myxococcota bacterium]
MSLLLIHGGAGRLRSEERQAAIAEALTAISQAAWPTLTAAGARAAVVHAVQLLEDNPLFNAGLGSKLQVDGAARLSASLCDGTRQRFSGVVNVEGLANPILLCRQLLEERDRVLAGEGALQRARELGLRTADMRTEEAIENWKQGLEGHTGTVGAVAVDSAGQVAAASSTGGRGLERQGRVSDSCTVAGNYANRTAAITTTGVGEDIIDGALAVRLAESTRRGEALDQAADELIQEMESREWKAGFIGLDTQGGWVARHTTEAMYWWVRSEHTDRGFWNASTSLG